MQVALPFIAMFTCNESLVSLQFEVITVMTLFIVLQLSDIHVNHPFQPLMSHSRNSALEVMRFIREDRFTIQINSNETRRDVFYLIFLCQEREACPSSNGEVSFRNDTGYVNPFDH